MTGVNPAPGAGDELEWRKSTFSTLGNCVEVSIASAEIAVRDSKDPSGPRLRFSPAEWAAFLDGVKNGEFDQQ